MKVVIAPDSFKGSVLAGRAAAALRRGWLDVRPDDEIHALPLADGGEGTIDAIAAAAPDARSMSTRVDGPAGPVDAPWLLLPDGTAVAELAVACGLPMWPQPDPLGAHTGALGQVLRAAAAHPDVRRLVIALGGSASTDGGVGVLRTLGAEFVLDDDSRMPWGPPPLSRVVRVDLAKLAPPPRDGVEILSDVTAPLLGILGAAAQFGPQKGATPAQVEHLEAGLAHLADLLGGHPDQEGAGAAGGTAYGLAAAWGASLTPGSAAVAAIVGLGPALDAADLVITGEGRLDAQSFRGKVVGQVVAQARSRDLDVAVCVGIADPEITHDLAHCVTLTELAGSSAAAIARPEPWLAEAGRHLAARFPRA